jgi:hypothetical protein
MKSKSIPRFCPLLFIVILVFLTNSCKNQKDNENVIGIGKIFAGGIIFYIDGTGQHGLVCSSQDQVGSPWGCQGTIIQGADGIVVGTGNQNTTDILNGCSLNYTAAYICANLDLNGYTDWYLPSKDELNLIYQNLKKKGLSNFTTRNYQGTLLFYWSSTELSNLNAWCQEFENGWGLQDGGFKDSWSLVRAIRAF